MLEYTILIVFYIFILQLPTAYYNIAVQVQKKAAVPLLPPPSSSGEGDDGEDYMNEEPEGVFHIYSNQKELLAQVCEVV